MATSPFADSNQARSIQEDYMAILESILKRIKELTGKKDPRITIKFGNEPASYKKDSQRGVEHNSMDAEKVAQLKQALEDPKSLGKSLQIFVDGKLAYHADREGNVNVDTIGLRSLQKVQQMNQFSQARLISPLAPELQKSKDIQHLSQAAPPLTLEGLQQQISQLQQTVDKQQQVINALNQAVEKISSSIVPYRTTDPTLFNWLTVTKQTLKAAGQSLVGKLSQMREEFQLQATDKVQKVKLQVTDKVQDVNSNVTQKAQDLRTNVVTSIHQSIAQAKGRMIESATKLMLEHIGEHHPDGSRTYESKNYIFSQKHGQILIASKDGRGEVMKNGEFTAAANFEDEQRLDNMAQAAHKDFTPDQSQTLRVSETQQVVQNSVQKR